MSPATQFLIGMGLIALFWLASKGVERLALRIHLAGLEAQRRRAERPEAEAEAAPRATVTSSAGPAAESAAEVRSAVQAAPAAPEPAANEPANGPNAAPARRTEAGTGSVALELTPEEAAAIRAAVASLRTARQPTKAGVIEAAFGLKRGGGRRYQRASELYDLLLAEPEPQAGPRYGARTAEQQKVQEWVKDDSKLPADTAVLTGGISG